MVLSLLYPLLSRKMRRQGTKLRELTQRRKVSAFSLAPRRAQRNKVVGFPHRMGFFPAFPTTLFSNIVLFVFSTPVVLAPTTQPTPIQDTERRGLWVGGGGTAEEL